jgi:protein-S-isoprenylcysteine O-methyltransferase Ste14
MSFSYLLLTICGIWVASEVLLVIFRRAEPGSEKRDAGSVVWLNVIVYSSVVLGIGAALSGTGIIHGVTQVVPWVGICLIMLGLAIRWVSIWRLWRYFTVDVAIRSDHRLVQTGIYRLIRHPSYLGSIVSFVGLGIAFCNWLTFALVLVPVTVSFMRRIQIEERALRERFGDEYVAYCERTKRLIPWVY